MVAFLDYPMTCANAEDALHKVMEIYANVNPNSDVCRILDKFSEAWTNCRYLESAEANSALQESMQLVQRFSHKTTRGISSALFKRCFIMHNLYCLKLLRSKAFYSRKTTHLLVCRVTNLEDFLIALA